MTITIDARGLPCPQPVIRTRNAIRDAVAQQTNEMIVLVSTEDQAHNVQRLAQKKGWVATIAVDGDSFRLALVAGSDSADATPAAQATRPTAPRSASGPTIILVTSDKMGEGDDDLGGILMRAFFHTLTELDVPPCKTVILYNSGVYLATEGSEVIDDLVLLEDAGVEVLACGTCLQHYGLTLAVGSVTNMYAIAETLLEAGHIVRP